MNTPDLAIHLIVSAMNGLVIPVAFHIAYRHTRLQGFQLLFLASAAGFLLGIVQSAAAILLPEFTSLQEVAGYLVGFGYPSMVIAAAQFAALFILVSQFLSAGRIREVAGG